MLAAGFLITTQSCVSNKKFSAIQSERDAAKSENAQINEALKNCQTLSKENERKLTEYANENQYLKKQVDYMKENNTQVLGRMQDLSVLNSTQAESVKKSLDKISQQDGFIRDLQSSMARKDSLNMSLILNLKGSLKDVNDKDVNVQVEKGVVYISISDKLLFASGSSQVLTPAKAVLGKVAQVLNDKPGFEFIVEGHTDDKPISNGCIQDNWDLSVKRATAVTRILQEEYKIDPKRITAAGRSSYLPVAGNDTVEGRTANRRTRIIIQPQLDQFFQLLEPKS